MYLAGIGLAVPETSYTQAQCWQALQTAAPRLALNARSWSLLRKVLLGDSWIERRHLTYTDLAEAFDPSPDSLHYRFRRHAPELAAHAARRALADAGLTPVELDAVVISTCTGYLCPGLTSYVVEQLGLRSDIATFDLVGHGCAAAIPNWQMADALLAGGRARCVLTICVEIRSAAMYLDDDPGVLISACLFGDGASALIFSAEPPSQGRRVRWRHFENATIPARRDLLRFEQRDGKLRNILSIEVPAVAAPAAREVLDNALRRTGVARADIRRWLLHPGGKTVLLALRDALELTDADLALSRAVLRQYGNLSSASLGFILHAALTGPTPAGYWWLGSFGAGFACHGALVEVEPCRP